MIIPLKSMKIDEELEYIIDKDMLVFASLPKADRISSSITLRELLEK